MIPRDPTLGGLGTILEVCVRRFRWVAAFAALTMVLVVGASPAGATPPANVVIEAAFEGDFAAIGSAVETGVVCGTGTVETTHREAAGFQSSRGTTLKVGKLFTCADGSGTFSAELQVRIVFGEGAWFQWVITGGTGDYENLQGSGSGAAIEEDTDMYQGGLHLH